MVKKLAIVLGLVVVVIIVVAWVVHYRHDDSAAGSAQATTAAHTGKRSHGENGPVPVTVAAAHPQDMPVYLDGLGTVQAFNTATVRAQVGGQLISVPFKEGGKVKKGDLLAKIDPRSFQATLDQALAKLAQDQAQLKSVQMDLARYQKLAPQGYVSGQQLDQQQQLVDQDAAVVKADRAAVESDRIQLSYTDIRAPISGRLGIRQVDVGNLVSASDTTGIVTITQTQPISVVFTLPEQALAQLRAAGGEPLPVTALNRNNSTAIANGQLTVINNQIDQSTGTIELKATFLNKNEALWPGQFVNVQLLASTLHNALVVPTAAVQRGPNGAYVYVVNNKTAELKPITTGQSQGDYTQVLKGLKVGDQAVVDGAYLLKPGAEVRIEPTAPPAANASTAAAASAG